MQALKQDLQATFDITDLGLLEYYLGIQFLQTEDSIHILQNKYIHTILKKFNMENAKPISTPMETNVNLNDQNPGPAFWLHHICLSNKMSPVSMQH